jgi:hypothetical protein
LKQVESWKVTSGLVFNSTIYSSLIANEPGGKFPEST